MENQSVDETEILKSDDIAADVGQYVISAGFLSFLNFFRRVKGKMGAL